MKAVGAVVGLILVFLIGGFVQYRFGVPFDTLLGSRTVATAAALLPAPGLGNTYVPRAGYARGAEDAARNDVAQGAATDKQRCLNTMAMRGLKPDMAEDTCSKIISGISR